MAYIGKEPASGIRNRFIFTATAGQTTLSGTDDHNRTLSYTDAEFTDVFLNGIKLDKSDYTATSGTSIVLDEAAAVDDIVEVIAFDTFSVFSGEFSQDVTVGGTVTADGLTVDTNTLYVDSTNNKVGIGTSLPSAKFHLVGSANSEYMRVGGSTRPLRFSSSAVGPATDAAHNIDVDSSAGHLSFSIGTVERLRIESNGNLQHLSKPAYFARAWVNFKGTGTVSIRESGNVSSVTDLGTGDYRVNFSTAMTDADYSIHFGGSPQNGRFLVNWAGTINNNSTAVVNSTSNCRIAMIYGATGSRSDSTNNYVSIFR